MTINGIQHRLGISWADNCKFNIYASIGHLCKCWADIFQMPHHRLFLNRSLNKINLYM